MALSKKRIKIGLIGMGQWAQESYVPYFLSQKNKICICALSNIVPNKKAEELAQKYNIQNTYSDYKTMIIKEKLDAAVITTPHLLHFEQIKFALENNLHILTDKPPAFTKTDVELLLQIVKKNKLIAMVFAQRRYWTEYIYSKQVIAKGLLGKLRIIHGVFGQEVFPDFIGSWRADPKLAGGGIVIDSGYHLIDTALFISDAKPMHIVMFANRGEFKSDTFASINLKFNKNILASFLVIRGLPKKSATEEIIFHGSEGIITIKRNKEQGKRTIELTHLNKKGELLKKIREDKAFPNNIAPAENFINAILSQEPLASSLDHSIATVTTIEAAYKSWKKGSIEDIKL